MRAVPAILMAFLLMLRFAAPATAEPAMWVIKDDDSTIYLLGTFHMVKPGTDWRSAKINDAFASSDEVWLEATEGDDPTMIQSLAMKYGLDPQHPLSSKLPSDARAKLDEAAKAMGLRSAMLEPLRPWMAALTITVAPLMRAGYDPGMGIDKSLEGDAERAHKSVRTFETPEQQILLFANLPEETELKFFLQTLDETAAAPKMVDQMADAWLDGDLEALDSLVFDKMKQGAPELYDIMIVERNRDWSKQIATLMKGAGTTFVAVGAGHLTGDNSVQALLAQQGFDVARY